MSNLLTPRKVYKPFEYHQAYTFMQLQQNNFWLPKEVPMTQDKADFERSLTESEQLILGQILKSFTQTETHINEYWSQNVSKWFPKPEIQMMCSTFSSFECFDKDTEILTSEGWVSVEKLTEDMKFANYDLESKSVSFEKATKLHKYRFTGNLHHYSSKNTDIMVTPNHDLIYRDWETA